MQRWTQRNYSGLNIYDKPSTAFLGWRRLRLKEILMLEEGEFIIVTIPPQTDGGRGYDSLAEQMRAAFRKRLTQAVMRTKSNEFENWTIKSLKFEVKIVKNFFGCP